MAVNPIIFPLKLDGVNCRSHKMLGIFKLNNTIIFLHTILGDVPKEQITRNTVFPNYIIADFFSLDFKTRSQSMLMYQEKKVLYETICKCIKSEGSLILNTMAYSALGNHGHDALAKLIKIQNSSMCEFGDSPAPVQKIYSDNKTYTFGDYDVRMTSDFIMEGINNRISSIDMWKLNLNAYLYTEIEEKDGMLYFGTAGKGGRFYGVSLQDGKVIFSYDTGGTVRYYWLEDSVFLIGRKENIVQIDCKTGIELRRFDFRKEKLRVLPQMLINDNKLYAAAYQNKDYYKFCALLIDLA